MIIPTFKFGAVFGQGNISRTREIVMSNRDPKKLSKIPPSFIVMDLTWKCNYHCNCCIDGNVVNKDPRNLRKELIEDIFDYSKSRGVRGIMTMGGEVFLYREGIQKALEKSIEYKIPLKTVTNGSLLKPYIHDIIEAYKIPGSMLRVSVNSGRENYKKQTRGISDFREIFNSIKKITSKNTRVFVSSVIFPESTKSSGAIENLGDIPEIAKECENAGVECYILIPARNPKTKEAYPLNDTELNYLRKFKEIKNSVKIEMADFFNQFSHNQNINYHPCPSGFLFTLIGSNGNIYKCTDNRGRGSMVIGKIEKSGEFEKFWHSEERVKKQFYTECTNKGCIRYKVNVLLDNACRLYSDRGISIDDYLEQERNDLIFI